MRPGRPNLTILSFGNNDAWEDTDNGVRATAPLEFSRQTQRLASLLMEHGDVLYVGFPRCDEEKVDHYRGKNIKLVNDALYLYEEMACQAVLAAARRMRGRAAAVPLHAMSWDNPKCTLGPDGLHPSPEGHRAIAETIAPVFDDMLGHLS
jgi:lysophospholipase L1-like esterase